MKLIFSDNFRNKISNFKKLQVVGVELFHAEKQRDMTQLIVAFRNFVKAPKNNTHETAQTTTSQIIRSQISEITKQYLEIGFNNKLKYNIRYKTYIIDTILYFIKQYYIIIPATCFGPICRTIFRLIFIQVECTIYKSCLEFWVLFGRFSLVWRVVSLVWRVVDSGRVLGAG